MQTFLRTESSLRLRAAAYPREHLSMAQYARFLVVGGIVGVVTIAAREVFQRLTGADTVWHYSLSVVAAYSLGILLSFALNRRFTFGSYVDPAIGLSTRSASASAPWARSTWRMFGSFALLAVAGLLSTWLLSLALRYGLPVERFLGAAGPGAAFGAAALLSTLITYPLNARYVFVRRPAFARRAEDC